MSEGYSRVFVCCASSRQCDPLHLEAGRRLGETFAGHGLITVTGGGGLGVMGAVADGALAAGGSVIGIIPRFMKERGWGHDGLTEMLVVADMHERSRAMLEGADGFVVLPGGSGTFEEMFQAISWKRLGLHTGPVVIVNLDGFYRPALELLDSCIRGKFMDRRHADMWSVVDSVDLVVDALRRAPPWDSNAIEFASL